MLFPFSHLNIHHRTYASEKPYKCTLCGTFFTQKNHLKSHERIHTDHTSVLFVESYLLSQLI